MTRSCQSINGARSGHLNTILSSLRLRHKLPLNEGQFSSGFIALREQYLVLITTTSQLFGTPHLPNRPFRDKGCEAPSTVN